MRVTWGAEFFPVSATPEPLAPMRERVQALQDELAKLPQFEPETKHYFHGGMYCREVFRPAGVLVVGKVHLKEHFYIIASGTVAITAEGEAREVTGPAVICSKPGTKRAVLALTDATCMTFHACEATTPEKAEMELVEPDALALFDAQNKVKKEILT